MLESSLYGVQQTAGEAYGGFVLQTWQTEVECTNSFCTFKISPAMQCRESGLHCAPASCASLLCAGVGGEACGGGGEGRDVLWERVDGASGAVGRGGAPLAPEGGSCALLALSMRQTLHHGSGKVR